MGYARRGSGKPTISISFVLFIFYVVRSGCKLKSSRNSSIKLNNRSAESKQKTIGIRYVRNVKKSLECMWLIFYPATRSYFTCFHDLIRGTTESESQESDNAVSVLVFYPTTKAYNVNDTKVRLINI